MTCDNIYMLIDDELITYSLSACPLINCTKLVLNGASDALASIFKGLVDSLMIKTGVEIPYQVLFNIKNREA
jgi:hypothetical protein